MPVRRLFADFWAQNITNSEGCKRGEGICK